MTRTSSKASKAAYKRCTETCQKVLAEISKAIEIRLETFGLEMNRYNVSELAHDAFNAALTHGTEPLRNALIECENELIETKDALYQAEDALKDALSTADFLRDEVAGLENDLDSSRSEAQSSRS